MSCSIRIYFVRQITDKCNHRDYLLSKFISAWLVRTNLILKVQRYLENSTCMIFIVLFVYVWGGLILKPRLHGIFVPLVPFLRFQSKFSWDRCMYSADTSRVSAENFDWNLRNLRSGAKNHGYWSSGSGWGVRLESILLDKWPISVTLTSTLD